MQPNQSGQRIGQYTLGKLLGQGGMGAVYESFQTGTNRKVAIKILPASLAQEKGYLDRFKKEVEIAAKLEHLHILPIYEFGTDAESGVSYIVMRLLTGGDLQKRLEKLGRPPVAIALKILEQIASALDHAHRYQVIHRDIKTNNIMFDEQGNAYLADFGIAKALGTTSMTGSSGAIGTPMYMAPEIWQGEAASPQSDVYALGVVAYEMFVGQAPFSAETPYALMFKHINETPPAPTSIQPALTKEMDIVLSRVLAKNPADRYPTCAAFIMALKSAMAGLPSYEMRETGFATMRIDTGKTGQPYTEPRVRGGSAAPTLRAEGRGRLLPLIAGALLLLAIGAGLAFALLSAGGGEPESNAAQVAPTQAPTEAAQAPSATLRAGQPSLTPSDTPLPTDTPSPTATATASATATPTDTVTPSPTATPSATFTPTLDLRAVAQGTRNAESTVNAQLTAFAQEETATQGAIFTATAAVWTDTPVPSATPRPSNTPRPLPTQVPPTQAPTERPTARPTEVAEVVPPAASGAGRIVFASSQGGADLEIYTINPDGSDLRQLTNNSADDNIPAWSPDYTQIAFESNQDGKYNIYIMDADGSNQRRITNNGANNYGPAWSPDGTRLVLHSTLDGDAELYIMDLNGNFEAQLTNNSATDRSAAWSPNGRYIAYHSDVSGGREIYVYDLNTGNTTRLTNNDKFDGLVDWSPDGRLLAFGSTRDSNQDELYIMNADGGNVRRLTFRNGIDAQPRFSPDGGQLVFEAEFTGRYQLWLINVDGSGLAQLTNFSGDSWSADW